MYIHRIYTYVYLCECTPLCVYIYIYMYVSSIVTSQRDGLKQTLNNTMKDNKQQTYYKRLRHNKQKHTTKDSSEEKGKPKKLGSSCCSGWPQSGPWGNTDRVASNRVVSKGPRYPSRTKQLLLISTY